MSSPAGGPHKAGEAGLRMGKIAKEFSRILSTVSVYIFHNSNSSNSSSNNNNKKTQTQTRTTTNKNGDGDGDGDDGDGDGDDNDDDDDDDDIICISSVCVCALQCHDIVCGISLHEQSWSRNSNISGFSRGFLDAQVTLQFSQVVWVPVPNQTRGSAACVALRHLPTLKSVEVMRFQKLGLPVTR